jgi:dissimilatory sulfite reductase (desulfoviridin) alpha/beta subunit
MNEPIVGGIVFNPEACNGCGSCVESCQLKAWSISGNRSPRGVFPAQHLGHKCIPCGTCYYFCPQLGAITLSHCKKTPPREKRHVHAA